MPSSTDRTRACRALGAFLTATEARQVAARLEDDEPLSVALQAVDNGRRPHAVDLVAATGFGEEDAPALAAILRSVEGAKSVETAVQPIWTMPGHLVTTSPLTSSTVQLVNSARTSVVCSTYNFQDTSGLWQALRDAARRDGVCVRVYVDDAATRPPADPDVDRIPAWLHPVVVLRTRAVAGSLVRNHAKFVSVDHRFLVITSANYSWSAENRNIELGVRLDDQPLAASIEHQLQTVERELYERAVPSSWHQRCQQ